MPEPLEPDAFNAIVMGMTHPLQFELTPMQAVVILAQLHIALRHPDNTGAAAEITREFASLLEDGLTMQNPKIQPNLKSAWKENPNDLDHC